MRRGNAISSSKHTSELTSPLAADANFPNLVGKVFGLQEKEGVGALLKGPQVITYPLTH